MRSCCSKQPRIVLMSLPGFAVTQLFSREGARLNSARGYMLSRVSVRSHHLQVAPNSAVPLSALERRFLVPSPTDPEVESATRTTEARGRGLWTLNQGTAGEVSSIVVACGRWVNGCRSDFASQFSAWLYYQKVWHSDEISINWSRGTAARLETNLSRPRNYIAVHGSGNLLTTIIILGNQVGEKYVQVVGKARNPS